MGGEDGGGKEGGVIPLCYCVRRVERMPGELGEKRHRLSGLEHHARSELSAGTIFLHFNGILLTDW